MNDRRMEAISCHLIAKRDFAGSQIIKNGRARLFFWWIRQTKRRARPTLGYCARP